MSSSATSSNQNPSENSDSDIPKQSPVPKQTKESSSESHQRDPQDTSSEGPPRAYKLGDETDTLTELERYDQNAKIWITIHTWWLAWNVFTCLPNLRIKFFEPLSESRDGVFLFNTIFLLLRTAPYLYQLWGIHKRSLKATDKGIKYLCIYGCFAALTFLMGSFAYFYAEEIYVAGKTNIRFLREKMPDHPHLKLLPPMPDWEDLEEESWELFKDRTGSLVYHVVGYFAARKFRNYLTKREKFLKKTE